MRMVVCVKWPWLRMDINTTLYTSIPRGIELYMYSTLSPSRRTQVYNPLFLHSSPVYKKVYTHPLSTNYPP